MITSRLNGSEVISKQHTDSLSSERPSVNQKRDESIVERTVRAVNHCRIALLAGYTTYRSNHIPGTNSDKTDDYYVEI